MGSRTQYNISPDTYLGLDVMYAKLQSANFGPLAPTTCRDNLADISKLMWTTGQFRFRVHKDFYP